MSTLLLTILFVSTTLWAFGQKNITISGTIKNNTSGKTFIGASARIKKLPSNGTSTNSYGFYSIPVPERDYTLVYTYIGYEAISRQVSLHKVQIVDVELTPNNSFKELLISANQPDIDQIGIANYYRFVLFINGVQVKAVFAFNDGRTVNLNLRQSDIDIYAGDTVEMQCIAKATYLYWYTLSQQGDNGPGGSVTPADPPTNISPVSLGYFSAHTTQSTSIKVTQVRSFKYFRTQSKLYGKARQKKIYYTIFRTFRRRFFYGFPFQKRNCQKVPVQIPKQSVGKNIGIPG